MAKCDVCSKDTKFGNNRSHALNQTNRTFKANIKKVRISESGIVRTAHVCTRCLRSNKVTRAV